MKVLLFGKKGQLAWELHRSFGVLGQIHCVGSDQANFERPDSLAKIIREYQPSHIINAAAYTGVDRAESEADIAMQVNGRSVGVLAEVAQSIGAKLIHYSTDYVFDGSKSNPYLETDLTGPLNVYGQSKLLGEKLIQEVNGDYLIFRVSWLYGNRGHNFLNTMFRLGQERESLSIVSDQIGAPTWVRNLSEATANVLSRKDFVDHKGIYHITPSGFVSWCGFASKIFEIARSQGLGGSIRVGRISEIASVDFKTPAKRPLNSRMDSGKIREHFGIELPSWEEALLRVMEDRAVLHGFV